ncbi:PREDICTED: probable BOI-related E3 ubiquitin-protein ligase 3 isoform X2 [Lupinus angustifolius]|uniref:probable BOI-related E3 ubiquitin-protein ligase 3 isoform X2 n=1 Tax=Lupinus angustifolius TaxID=3871 RepID=UPI00092E57A7|nr:PREDICTED: probable BOI-related E3 ubiquitin-protein ligase 3 isoform X2 [Lupinus angustifolius]
MMMMNNYSLVFPLLETTTVTASETLHHPAPPYSSLIPDSFATLKTITAMKSDVSTTNVSVSRKRSIDSVDYRLPYNKNRATDFSFLGEHLFIQIHQQQLEIDNLVSQHMEKVRMELEEKRKRQVRMLMESIELRVMKRLKSKEEDIETIEKLNIALEEKVNSLCIENQIWRDLAQTNEANANALRSNLMQALTNVKESAGEDGGATVGAAANDAESCCGSNDENEVWRMIAGGAHDKEEERSERMCRKCGKEESCVVILPCRHLCLCTVCVSTLQICPICNSFKNATLHVNLI